jgi:hypothetical protein
MPKPENVVGKGFEKHPERINKTGLNKKVLTTLTDYIEKTYGKRPPKSEVISLMEYIECLPVNQLTIFLQDKNIPAIIQAYGRLLLSGEQKDLRRVYGAEMLNDRLHGKPKQQTEITGDFKLIWQETKTYAKPKD